MRIGIVCDLAPSEYGGARTLQESLIRAFGEFESDHDIVLLNVGRSPFGSSSRMINQCVDVHHSFASSSDAHSFHSPSPFYALRRRILGKLSRLFSWSPSFIPMLSKANNAAPDTASLSMTPLQRAVSDLQIDILWRPDVWIEPLDTPYCVTAWDIHFRLQAFFPEFSPKGMSWEDRESHHVRTLRRAALVFTGTETGREQLIHYYGLNPDNVIVNPYPVSHFVNGRSHDSTWSSLCRRGLTDGYIFYPAAFWPHKNHVNLMLGLAELRKSYGLEPQVVLTGADAGNAAYVKELVKGLDLDRQVILMGFCSQSEVAALYKHSLALVYPSFVGPDNLPPLEAFASGCPVIASDIPGAREQLGDAAVFFDPASPESIASAMASVILDKSLRDLMVDRGLRIADVRTCGNYARTILYSLSNLEPYLRTWRSDYQLAF